jgi:EpsI family protein
MRLAPLVATLLFALLPLAVAVSREHAAGRALPLDLSAAPQTLAHYRAVKDEPLDAPVLDMLEPDAYLMRLYASQRGENAWLYLAAYSATGSTGAHDPSVCYPAQGWDLQGLHNLELELAGGESLVGRMMLATQAGQEELVLYWFQPVGRWPERAPWEPLLRAYDGFSGRPQYVFVRLSAPRGEKTQEELVAMGRELAPWLRGAMDGASAAGE